MKATAKVSAIGVILIAGANAKLRHQWRQGLTGRRTVYEVAERAELERSLTAFQPAVLLLDLALCDANRVGEVSTLQSLSPSTKVVLFTKNPDPAEGISALKMGAKGYCSKDIQPELLEKAVEMVQEGQIWVERAVIPFLLGELASAGGHQAPISSPKLPQDNLLDCLTPRERAVADLIAAGGWNKEIACRLTITEATVKAHLTAIFRKLGVTDRLQLGLFLARHGQTGPKSAQPLDHGQVPYNDEPVRKAPDGCEEPVEGRAALARLA
jgi:DNA-binding NarL/FixJ family response regulator